MAESMFDYSGYSDDELVECRRIHSTGVTKLEAKIRHLEEQLDACRSARDMRQTEFEAIVAERSRRRDRAR